MYFQIEEESAKPVSLPNFVDNILSSMDKITKKKIEKPTPEKEATPKRISESSEEAKLRENCEKQREEEKRRQQERRIKEVKNSKINFDQLECMFI